jgi:hypothetical protein
MGAVILLAEVVAFFAGPGSGQPHGARHGPRLDRGLILVRGSGRTAYQNDRSVPGLILLTRKLRKKKPK